MIRKARLKTGLEALGRNLLPQKRDLRHEIVVRAFATALSPQELDMLRDSAQEGVVELPPEMRFQTVHRTPKTAFLFFERAREYSDATVRPVRHYGRPRNT